MIIDTLATLADAAALDTSATGTSALGTVLDMAFANQNPGTAAPLHLVISVATTASSAGAATLTLELVSADSADLSDATTLLTTATFALASLSAGTRLANMVLPSASYGRYLGLRQVIGTAAFTAGAIDAFLTPTPSDWRAMPEGV